MPKHVLYIIFFLVVISLSSCLQLANEVKNWTEFETIDDVSGTYHFLENDGIKIYLPDVFKRYSAVEYEHVLDSLVSKESFELEVKRLNNMRNMEGDFYIFFDELTRSTYTINTGPYLPMQKRDAQLLLGMINQNFEKISEDSNYVATKLTAKYSSNSGTQIFKAVYRVDNHVENTTTYSSTYLVSSNHNSVIINLSTPYEVSFDLFLQKMIL